eukprot:7312331-Prorocentrum_lima.AAC.1
MNTTGALTSHGPYNHITNRRRRDSRDVAMPVGTHEQWEREAQEHQNLKLHRISQECPKKVHDATAAEEQEPRI